jgi:DNA-binding transcriptional LysR family regulator
MLTGELHELEHFAAAAKEGSLAAAAGLCGCSQEDILGAIRSLEKQVKVPLLIFEEDRVSLTAAGAAFLNEALPALEKFRGEYPGNAG